MGEKTEDHANDVNMNNSKIKFDNLTILREFSNIVNLVRNEDFLEMVPKAKLKRVKWVPMFNCLKQGILDEMVQELSSMWEYENIPNKLEILEKQKDKFGDVGTEQILWRPQLGDVEAQLRVSNVANLQKQKTLLESLVKEYDTRVDKLKKTLSAKRGYHKALQMDIQKYQRKNDELVTKIGDNIKTRNTINMCLSGGNNVEKLCWKEKEICWEEENEIN